MKHRLFGYTRRNAFTLIELLVVVAVIAVLAAILYPVYLHVKARGRQAVCLSNVRQIGASMDSYSQDWHDALPFPCNEQDPGIWWAGTWRERIQRYCKSHTLFICPEPTKYPDVWAMGGYETGHYGISFTMTHRPYTQTSLPLPFGFSYAYEVTRPSMTILVGENKDGDWSSEPLSSYTGDSGYSGHFWAYHSNGGVWLFCDGHTAWMPVRRTEKDGFFLWRKVKN